METIRVVIADDHPFFRDGLRLMLESAPEMELIGEATNGEVAVSLALELHPDVILMDLKMPGLNGIQATRRILERNDDIAILVLTMFEDDDSVFASIQAGARGYLLKGADRDEVLLAIRAASRGEAIFGPGIARRLAHYFTPAASTPRPDAFPELTEREREVLDLMARGWSNEDIAQQLVLSPKTIRNHVSTILNKLQVSSRSYAIVRAKEAGLGGTPTEDLER